MRIILYKFAIGQCVMWSGGFGNQPEEPARITGRGEKNDCPIYDLDNGHWAYEEQLSEVEI